MNFRIHTYDRLDSTNTFLKERVGKEGDAPCGTVIVARTQQSGRGRRGRAWVSGADENLTFSVWLPGETDPRDGPSCGMAAALAAHDFLLGQGIPACLKWPNDVLVNRKKICGILSERLPRGLVVGIGLNVNMRGVSGIDQPATSLRIETGRAWALDDLLSELLEPLGRRLDAWQTGGFPAIQADWEAAIPDVGRPVTVRDGDRPRSGVLHGFGPCGQLLLRNSDSRLHEVWAGDVECFD